MNLNVEKIIKDISECKLCELHKHRNKTVPGDGSYSSKIMFIGEGPGEEEDIQGRPFVGRSGKLLTKILESTGFDRGTVFITNIVKCRPPKNRDPEAVEIKACSVYLESQIAIINPKVIVTVGAVSTKAILGFKEGITKLRGELFEWRGIKVMPILHPSYLLRNPSLEKNKPKWLTWQDMLKLKEIVK
jgi:DNA polymerase